MRCVSWLGGFDFDLDNLFSDLYFLTHHNNKQGAPLSREDSTGGGFTLSSGSNCGGGDNTQLPNTQPPASASAWHGRRAESRSGPRRKRLRLTLANDQEAAWHGFVLPSGSSLLSSVPTQFAPGTEGQDGQEMLVGLDGMQVCGEEGDVGGDDGGVARPQQQQREQGRASMVFGGGMTTGEIIALRQQQQQEFVEREQHETETLPNSSR